MVVYVTPAGKTAAMLPNFLERPQEEFRFDVAIILCSSEMRRALAEKCKDYNAALIEIRNPYFGSADYESVLTRLLLAILTCGGQTIDRVVINSSGGTEKMSSIIKELFETLRLQYTTEHVFGTYLVNTGEVVFTHCPNIDRPGVLSSVLESVQIADEARRLEDAVHLDEHEERD